MKKVTISSTVLAASLCFGTQSAMAAGSLEDKDMLFAFGAESSVNTMMLSEQEMVDTEGNWWFTPVIAYTVGGAAMGAYHSYRTTGSVGWRDVGAGATAGFYASPMGRPLGNAGRFVMGWAGASAWYW